MPRKTAVTARKMSASSILQAFRAASAAARKPAPPVTPASRPAASAPEAPASSKTSAAVLLRACPALTAACTARPRSPARRWVKRARCRANAARAPPACPRGSLATRARCHVTEASSPCPMAAIRSPTAARSQMPVTCAKPTMQAALPTPTAAPPSAWAVSAAWRTCVNRRARFAPPALTAAPARAAFRAKAESPEPANPRAVPARVRRALPPACAARVWCAATRWVIAARERAAAAVRC